MKEAHKKVLETWDTLGLAFGDFISHNELDQQFVGARPMALEFQSAGKLAQYDEAMQKWQLERFALVDTLKEALLIQRRMYLASEYGTGYRVLRPEEQIDHAVDKSRSRIINETQKIYRAAVNVEFSAIEDSTIRAEAMSKADAAQSLAVFIGDKARRTRIEFKY